MLGLSEEAKIKRDNLKLNHLRQKIKSIQEKSAKLPTSVSQLGTFSKMRMNVAEQHHELGVAIKRYCTFNRELFEERVQNRLDRKQKEMRIQADQLQVEVDKLVKSLDPATRVKAHEKPEVEKKSMFDVFKRDPVPEKS